METKINAEEWVEPKHAASTLSVSVQTIGRRCLDGTLSATDTNPNGKRRRWRISRRSVEEVAKVGKGG